MTCTDQEQLSSMYSPVDRTCTVNWRSTNDSLVKQLLAQFGKYPQKL